MTSTKLRLLREFVILTSYQKRELKNRRLALYSTLLYDTIKIDEVQCGRVQAWLCAARRDLLRLGDHPGDLCSELLVVTIFFLLCFVISHFPVGFTCAKNCDKKWRSKQQQCQDPMWEALCSALLRRTGNRRGNLCRQNGQHTNHQGTRNRPWCSVESPLRLNSCGH